MRRARDGREDDFLWLDAPQWGLALALTPDDKILMVRQWRFGAAEFSWEPPGGIIDAGECPLKAVARELLEETGYAGDAPEDLGWLYTNPALQKNRANFALIRNCAKVAEPTPDPNEDIEVKAFALPEAFAMAADGRIRHMGCAAALFKLAAHLKTFPTT